MKALITTIFLLAPTLVSAHGESVSVDPLIKRYCVRCHGPSEQKSDLRLDRFTDSDAATLEAVYEQIADGLMPPADQRQPTSAERKMLMRHVLELAKRDSVVTAPGLRRLNKREYGNTVRDLLGLKQGIFDPSEFIYADEVDEGFDTAAESLVISNELLMEYMDAADKSLRHSLFSDVASRPKSRVIDVDVGRMNGVGGGRYINNRKNHTILRCGGKAMVYDGRQSRTMQIPGRYKITVTASGVDRNTYAVPFVPTTGPLLMGIGVKQDGPTSVASKGKLLEKVELADGTDRMFQFDLWIDKGYFPFLSFVNGSSKPITQVRSNIRRQKIDRSAMKQPYHGPGIRISKFQVEGPFIDEWPPESIRTTFDAAEIPNLGDATAREDAVLRFATRAFRRRVTKREITPYLEFLNKQRPEASWHEATLRTFAAMMSSVDFLYIREGQGELDDDALASRLSYFLWSTMPDPELSSLARSGKLKQPAVLRQQVSRLLADERSTRFCDSFVDQWLSLDKLGSMPPDTKEYRSYYRDNLESAMLKETRLYFRDTLRNNQSVRAFIDSDYSFINQGLAKLYEVPFAGDGEEFARVSFDSSSKRGGILGHGSILTLTANGVETSPVERGVWVLASFLGTPPPPPPKEVPAITPDLNGAETVRDLLEKHRSDQACMECHRRMDPLGFALEAYDPVGRFRTKYSPKQPVSTKGNYLGKEFSDAAGLKRILAEDVRPFARNLIVRIAEYAKGRELVAADHSTVEDILSAVEKEGFKLKDIVYRVAISDLLTHR